MQAMVQIRNSDPVKFIDEIVFSPMPKRVKAVGFKLFYTVAHIRQEKFRCVFQHFKEMDDIKIIHLKRRNILRMHLSVKIALRQKKWLFGQEDQVDQSPVFLDYDELLNDIMKYERWKKEYDAFFENNQKIDVFYEELVSNFESEVVRIQKFLNVEPQRLKTIYKKQTTAPLSRLILNYNELKKRFEGTPWIYFFEE
jgi:LPS sulfotransferase NodH